jgi:NodT family efflux transporter outer membrane factor (OMF) lipoprotein
MKVAVRTLALSLAMAGCAVGPNYRPPTALPGRALKLSETQAAQTTPSPLPSHWWRLFDDSDLDRLVERALTHNTDLRQAAANLQRARAAASEANAGRWPDFGASTSYSRERVPVSPLGLAPPINRDFYTVGLDASYEIDLFGGVARSIQAARADAESAQAQVDAARVAVAAETAAAYAAACGFAQQAAVARETAALQADTRSLTQRLFEAGRGTERDTEEAEVLLQQTTARVPAFEAERQAALYSLAMLTGDPPADLDAAAARCATVPTAKVAIPVGDGAALLARRPDVHAAERTLAADVARIGVATAELYPTVTLAGAVNLGGVKPGDLGKNRSLTYSAGPLISWNIPLNGAARARVRESQAQAQVALAAFDGTVLAALKETEQALARLDGAVAREQVLARAAAASDRAADLSETRFRAGSDNFLQLLQAQRDRANARGELAQAQSDRAQAQIGLFKALGGGWEDAPVIASVELPAGHAAPIADRHR